MDNWISVKDRLPDYSARKRGIPTMPTADRIYSKTIKNENGCWEWQGATRNGYGRTTIGSRKDGTRRTISTHRLSYILNFGEIPEGMFVCHKCDNPRCINPDHLFLGTRQDNVDDREAKGRNNTQRGSKNGRSKLSEFDVIEIRKKRKLGATFGKLSQEYGVCKRTIIDAVNGKNWAHIEGYNLPEPPKGE